MSNPNRLKSKLKVCAPEIKNYVREIETENSKIHRKKVKLEVEILSLKNRIIALDLIKKLQNFILMSSISLVRKNSHNQAILQTRRARALWSRLV